MTTYPTSLHPFVEQLRFACDGGKTLDAAALRAQAFESGWDCAVRRHAKENPHQLLSPLYHEWETGYEAGEDMRRAIQ